MRVPVESAKWAGLTVEWGKARRLSRMKPCLLVLRLKRMWSDPIGGCGGILRQGQNWEQERGEGAKRRATVAQWVKPASVMPASHVDTC